MLLEEITAVYCDNRTKQISMLRENCRVIHSKATVHIPQGFKALMV
jgi:hypothetical protein